MTPVAFMFCAFGLSLAAGVLGALLGLGGGIIVVPALTLLLGVDIRYAIGASIVSVIATSSGAGAAYVKEHLANIRVAMVLELATTTGALGGAFVAGAIAGRWLYLIFAAALTYAAVAMWRKRALTGVERDAPDRIADALNLHGSYFDQRTGKERPYRVARTPVGLVLSGVAGVLSGLLGIGGGLIKVPAMALGMGIPIKVASATSNFMIGVTAAASAGVYFTRGDIDPFVAAPTALGVLGGSVVGARLIGRVRGSALRAAFTLVLAVVAVEMLLKGLKG
ncbi:MAG TPA: sulfite exporter TauE/SafE family protein [Phycisphaerae bacterium]|nr:sulfite exporter TauE/SafE family protein [Phycisphaerae bacterium]